jgi:uncharacterized protein
MTLYLDTSSLVKLYVREAGSDAVRQAVSQARVVATSVIAYAEMRAALARIRRHGGVTAAKFTLLKREFEEQWPAYLRVEVTHTLCRAAGDLANNTVCEGSTASTWLPFPMLLEVQVSGRRVSPASMTG